MKYISVTLYKGDYISRMNLSERHLNFYIECEEGNLSEEEVKTGCTIRLVKGNLPNTVKAVCTKINGEPIEGMFGGYFIYTSDSRFSTICRQIVGLNAYFGYPVALHDRIEN